MNTEDVDMEEEASENKQATSICEVCEDFKQVVEIDFNIQKRVGSPSITGSGQPNDDDIREDSDTDQDKLDTNDAETNTTDSEPITLTCSVCKHQLSSAWSLMQHIQVHLQMLHLQQIFLSQPTVLKFCKI